MKNKYHLWIAGIVLVAGMFAGCSTTSNKSHLVNSSESELDKNQKEITWLEVANSYRNVYLQSQESQLLGSLDTTHAMVATLGDAGYCVTAANNKLDLENKEQAATFITNCQSSVEDQLNLVLVRDEGGFILFHLTYSDETLHVKQSSVVWQQGEPVEEESVEYDACSWSYSEEGYFFFEQFHPLGYDGISGHHGIRVKPLDARCRYLTETYMAPVGYDMNNLFTTDWTENDLSAVDFNDLFEQMYYLTYGKQAPVSFNYTGLLYHFQREEYEQVFHTFFQISPETIQSKMKYQRQTDSYEYRPRGMYDSTPTAYIPTPEVVGFEDRDDGTILLTVNGVSMNDNESKIFRHEVVVRPMEDGRFQYVSNHVIEKNWEERPAWYRSRLTDAEWKELYQIE